MYYTDNYGEDIRKSLKAVDLRKLQGKSIMITGATGLIGSAIVDILCFFNTMQQEKIHVWAAVRDVVKARRRFEGCWESDFLKLIPYDACYPLSCSFKPDYIIHAAGNAHPQVYGEEPVETMTANFCGLYNLLEYAKRYGTTRLLYVSSSEIYGEKEDNSLYKEEDYGYVDILDPRSCYPSSKRAAETLCVAYQKEYGVETVIVRPGHVYGPTQTEKDSRASAQFLRQAVSGQNIIMKSLGMQLRSYCHCLDCATAILTVLLRGDAGESYNISNTSSVITIHEFAETCAKLAKVNIIFENAKKVEIENYNRMGCSALASKKLEDLGWNGSWNYVEGIYESLSRMKESECIVRN